jgi:hypothetical protein
MNNVIVTIDETGPATFCLDYPGRDVMAGFGGLEEDEDAQLEAIREQAFERVLRREVRPLPSGSIHARLVRDELGRLPSDGEVARAIADRILA